MRQDERVGAMLNIERALKQDRLLRALTGLNRKAFDNLLSTFNAVYEQSLLQQPRQRAMGGGRKARLHKAQDKLFYILLYFKCYPTFDLAGLLFDIDRAIRTSLDASSPINSRNCVG